MFRCISAVENPRGLNRPGTPTVAGTCHWFSIALLVTASTAVDAAYTAKTMQELPSTAFPALYYWSHNYYKGFGPHSTTYRYGAHPGYKRLTNYFRDLDTGHGFLVEHPAALLTIFDESEQHAVTTCCGYWQEIRAVYRTPPFNVRVSGGFGYFDAAWDADVWYRTDNTVRHVERYAEWNFALYSGRACPDNHGLWALNPGTGVEEYFCAPGSNLPDREMNLGNPSCSPESAMPPIDTGNPIHIATGNKFQRETVVAESGPAALGFELFYNSQSTGVDGRQKWTHSYERALNNLLEVALDNAAEISALPHSRYLSIRARRPDGRLLRFSNVLDWEARTTVDREWSGPRNLGDRLYSVEDPDTGEITGLLLKTPAGEQEHYALNGRLTKIVRPEGRVLNLAYRPEGLLDRVSDEFGNSLSFDYESGVLTSVTAPDEGVYRIAYDAEGNLADLSFPDLTPDDPTDNPHRRYHYEAVDLPTHLTGITDERGNRIASWSYDDQGRAVASQHADGTDTHTLLFNTDGTTTVTDAQGQARTYEFDIQNGLIKIASVSGGDCGQCGRDAASYTYDTEGFVASKTDFNGSLTTYVRDELGREISRTEAVGTPEARTVTTTWHQTINKPTRLEEPGRVTIHAYDAQGRLLSSTIQPLP